MQQFWMSVIAIFVLIESSEAAKRLVFEPYLFTGPNGQTVQAEFGKMIVPENRKDSASHDIELAMVRFRSTSANPGPPIVYLAVVPEDRESTQRAASGSLCSWRFVR